MSIQSTPVFYCWKSNRLMWPDITCSGAAIRRRAVRYGMDPTWYAEFACWNTAAGEAITVAQDGYTADFYLISPGESGKAGSGSAGGAGGGAGVPLTASGISLAAGTYTFNISQTITRVVMPGNTISAATPTGGYAAGSQYRLFDDPDEVYGAAGALNPPSAIVPAAGAGGCTFLPLKAVDTVYGSSATKIQSLTGASGVGAGGNGGARSDYCSTYLQGLINPGAGAMGMILMRVPMV